MNMNVNIVNNVNEIHHHNYFYLYFIEVTPRDFIISIYNYTKINLSGGGLIGFKWLRLKDLNLHQPLQKAFTDLESAGLHYPKPHARFFRELL